MKSTITAFVGGQSFLLSELHAIDRLITDPDYNHVTKEF